MTNDFLFALTSTKSKPTWRHSNWNGTDMICTVAEPPRKLPVFKPGKWSLLPDSRISLYGHDARSMKNLTLHFDMAEQCDCLDRSWFGEMWFPAENMSIRSNPLSPMTPCLIQQILTLNKGIANQSCASASCKFEIQLTHYLTVELLMCYFQDTCFEVVNVAVGKKKARCWRNEVYAEDRAHPVLPLSRLANLLDTEFIWENGEALMQCRDKGHWRCDQVRDSQ